MGITIVLALTVAVLALLIAWAAMRVWHVGPGTGPEELVGTTADARSAINPEGHVFADGCFWRAVNVGVDPISAGDQVRIEGRDGLRLKVRRAEPLPPSPAWAQIPPAE